MVAASIISITLNPAMFATIGPLDSSGGTANGRLRHDRSHDEDVRDDPPIAHTRATVRMLVIALTACVPWSRDEAPLPLTSTAATAKPIQSGTIAADRSNVGPREIQPARDWRRLVADHGSCSEQALSSEAMAAARPRSSIRWPDVPPRGSLGRTRDDRGAALLPDRKILLAPVAWGWCDPKARAARPRPRQRFTPGPQ